VLSWGLSAVLGPRSVQAAQRRRREDARRTSALFTRILIAAGVGSLLVFSHRWAGNPLGGLLPTAYAVEGLVFVTIIAVLAEGMVYPNRSELLGAGREATLVRVELATIGVRLLVAAAGRELQAFAIPTGSAAAAVMRLTVFRRALRTTYANEPDPSKATVAAGTAP
jgi:hypothetical protein